MLTQLHIQNIAVIQKASIPLEGGLNVFTGETGAGKTVLISAIDAVLGERTSRDIIRTGEEKALVSALFEDISTRARAALEEQGYPDEDGSILIVREITAAGKNSCKINGMPANVSVLKEIAPLLIHIHGQRDSQQLLASERHVELIDLYGETLPLLEEYRAAYRKMRGIEEELDGLNMDDAQKAQRMDMLSFQIAEIEGAKLEDPEEEDILQTQRKMIRNSEKILDGLSQGYQSLSGTEESEGISVLFDQLVGGVAAAAEYIEGLAPMAQRLEEMSYELSEYSGELRAQLEEFEFDPRELDGIEYRLDTIYKLKRKYGGSIAEILEYRDKAQAELEAISTSEKRREQLEAALEKATREAEKKAKQLSAKRTAAAKNFMAAVEGELAFLDMPSVKLSLSHQQRELGSGGIDDMELLIVTNVGELPKPLSKIASGGEVARIMLAVKNVLADRDDIDTLIFDEVDTGVSGRAAGKIGAKLSQVSHKRQVICVTHLAQVAAYADSHLLIRKEVEGKRTFTKVTVLEKQDVLRELARITSGDLITEAALKNAEELWNHAHQG